MEDNANLLECLKLEISASRELCCVGTFLSFEDAHPAISKRRPDVILLDLGLPGMDGIEACQLIRKGWPRTKILIFTGLSDPERIYSAFSSGADGFITKKTSRTDLVIAIERAYEGGSPISPEVEMALVDWFRQRETLMPHLSPTERLVLDLLDRGMPQKEVADKLQMNYQTLRSHINSILEKTGVSSVARALFIRRQSIR